MDVTSKFRKASEKVAVIRHYEPSRIERDLLAQVFEVVSDRVKLQAGHPAAEQSPMIPAALLGVSNVSRAGVQELEATKQKRLERVA